MTELLPVLKTIGVVLGTWTLVSAAATLVLVPWFRAQAHGNLALATRDRSEDWLRAAHSIGAREVVTR